MRRKYLLILAVIIVACSGQSQTPDGTSGSRFERPERPEGPDRDPRQRDDRRRRRGPDRPPLVQAGRLLRGPRPVVRGLERRRGRRHAGVRMNPHSHAARRRDLVVDRHVLDEVGQRLGVFRQIAALVVLTALAVAPAQAGWFDNETDDDAKAGHAAGSECFAEELVNP